MKNTITKFKEIIEAQEKQYRICSKFKNILEKYKGNELINHLKLYTIWLDTQISENKLSKEDRDIMKEWDDFWDDKDESEIEVKPKEYGS